MAEFISFTLYEWFLQEDHKFKQALRIKNPKNKLKKILDACKNKTKCEGGDEIEGQESEEPVKKSRGGCGAQQPKFSIDGMKMIAEYKAQRKKSDDQEQLPEPVERKQNLTAERVSQADLLGCTFCLFFHRQHILRGWHFAEFIVGS